jgi:molybdenum cofactor cytidylyltransferase
MGAVRRMEPPAEAVAVLVCDQARLSAGHLRALMDRHAARQVADSRAITASLYAGRAGVPAIFGAAWFSELEACSGDRGARDLLRAQAAEVQGIPWPAGEADIDRPEDLTTIEAKF